MSQTNDHPEDSLLHLEEELRALVPAETSAGLRDRIFAALANPVEDATAEPAVVAPPGRGWFGWVPLAAAAAVALLAVVLSPAPKGGENVATITPAAADSRDTATADSFSSDVVPVAWKPVSSDSRLEHVGYDGIRTEESATYRQIRTRSMERRTFVDPTNGTVVEVVFPRENIHLVPAVPE